MTISMSVSVTYIKNFSSEVAMGSEGISSSRGPEEVLLHSLPWRWDFNAVVKTR